MSDVNKEFKVGDGFCLTVENTFADVRISVGPDSVASVKMTGDEKLLKDIKLSQPNADSLLIKGQSAKANSSVSIFTTGSGSFSMNNFSSHGSVVSIGNGGVVSIGRGNVVMVNGKIVTGNGDGETIDELPQIEITVPLGSDLDISDSGNVTAIGLGGKVNAHLSNQDNLQITDASGLKIKCSGQSHCTIKNGAGDANLTVSGQSSIAVTGDLHNVEATSSGQASIALDGNCHDFSGDSSGQSNIYVRGRATGKVRQRESGQSRISVR